MKTGYLRKTQLYIIISCFILFSNGFLMHYSYQETLQGIQYQRLSHAYQHQLRSLEGSIADRSALYKQYIIHPKSRITLADLQITEQRIKTTLSNLIHASRGMLWEEPLSKLMDINQQFTSGATELVLSSERVVALKKSSGQVFAEMQQQENQKFAQQIDQLDFFLKNYIAQLRQIAGQADHLSAQDVNKQGQFFVLLNLLSCLIIGGLLLFIYYSIGYRLRRSIVNLTHALQDYSLFGAAIPIFKQERTTEIGHLAAAAQSFRDNVIENVIVTIRVSHPALFEEVGHVIVASKALKITVNEILDLYENSELKAKDLLQSSEQTRGTLRSIIKSSENFLEVVRESSAISKHKKIAPHLKNFEVLIEEAHKAIVKEQNTAKRITTLVKVESKQKRVFELLLELSIKMGHISGQLEKALSDFIQSSSTSEDDVIINRR